jgi:hypothetical protein
LNQADYFLPTGGDASHDLTSADWTVKYDVSENPEPLFFRALLNARYGNLQKAKVDSDLILSREPSDPSYRALAAYIAVLNGDKTLLGTFSAEQITDARALSLIGEAAYLGGDAGSAAAWWGRAVKFDRLSSGIACWAGKKHFTGGQRQIAKSLLIECKAMAPESKEGKEAQELLSKLESPGS